MLALLALDSVLRDAYREALIWLLLALIVDGIDGTLARRLHVAELVPQIDGASLDLVIDYLTYVLVPVLILWRGDFLLPVLALPLSALILLSSLYVFARRDMKTDDGYFRGFPALWNVIAFYFVLLPPAELTATAIVLVLILLTFAPIHVVHPLRTGDSRNAALGAVVIWLVSTAVLVLAGGAQPWRNTAAIASLGSLAVLAGIGFRRTSRGPR